MGTSHKLPGHIYLWRPAFAQEGSDQLKHIHSAERRRVFWSHIEQGPLASNALTSSDACRIDILPHIAKLRILPLNHNPCLDQLGYGLNTGI
eukprot:3506941-Pyramimonas_sp.AAC.1